MAHGVRHAVPRGRRELAVVRHRPRQARDLRDRTDFRAVPTVTIDGEHARDFDDAVFCEAKRGGGWRLWVAIADVSAYVKPGTALDTEAYQRGNSVYFPEFVVPMLPERISNDLCSLREKEERLRHRAARVEGHALHVARAVVDQQALGRDAGRELVDRKSVV